MEPSDDLVSVGHCLANPGREYVAFQGQATPFTLKLDGLSRPLTAEWYQPLTGRRAEAGTLGNGTARLQPPADWGDGPVALHVGERPGP
jgi:Putative collagen-binding domain of a collagenase